MRPPLQQQTQAFFVRGPSPFARLVFFAALSLVLMATDSRLRYLGEIRQVFVGMLYPIQVLANAPVTAYKDLEQFMTQHKTLLKQNVQLQEQALKLNAELQRLKTLENENGNLRQLFGVATASAQPAKLAEILHMGRDPFVHRIVVNLGANQNISPGQAVIDALGVIGQVTRVYPYSSEVTLVTDKDLAIPVQIERNSLRAIAFGHGRDSTIDLPYLPANVDIKQGDKLVTSGIDGIYPSGLAVAEVMSIKTNANSPFAQIVCKPVAGIENHRQVLLLNMQKPVPVTVSAIGNPEPPASIAASKASSEPAKSNAPSMPSKLKVNHEADNKPASRPEESSKPASKPEARPEQKREPQAEHKPEPKPTAAPELKIKAEAKPHAPN